MIKLLTISYFRRRIHILDEHWKMPRHRFFSHEFDAEKIYIWIPIVLAIDIGACMQVFILVLERDGETLPVWNKLMTLIHWRSGRGLMTHVFRAPTSDDGQPKRQETVMSTQAPQPPQPRTVRSAFSLHTVLALSMLFFLFRFILQLLGLVFASIGLHYAMKNNMTEKWCSPAFQLGSYVFDCANNYTILPTPETGVGCIWTSGMQSTYLTATVIILIVEIILEIVDATLLIMAQKDQQVWCLPWLKVKRPWCTMLFGTGIWVAMIAIGVIRGQTEALPVNGPVVEMGGVVGGPCHVTLYGNALRGAMIAWSDGAFQAWDSAYRGT